MGAPHTSRLTPRRGRFPSIKNDDVESPQGNAYGKRPNSCAPGWGLWLKSISPNDQLLDLGLGAKSWPAVCLSIQCTARGTATYGRVAMREI